VRCAPLSPQFNSALNPIAAKSSISERANLKPGIDLQQAAQLVQST